MKRFARELMRHGMPSLRSSLPAAHSGTNPSCRGVGAYQGNKKGGKWNKRGVKKGGEGGKKAAWHKRREQCECSSTKEKPKGRGMAGKNYKDMMKALHENWEDDEYDFDTPKEIMLSLIQEKFPETQPSALSIKRIKDGLIFFNKGDEFMEVYYVVNIETGDMFRVESAGDTVGISSHATCEDLLIVAQFSIHRSEVAHF